MGRVLGRKLIFAALIAAATMLGVADASAQAAKPPENQAATISNDAKSVRAKLDAYKADLDQRESALQGRDLSSRELQTMRLQIEPITESIFAQIESMTPRLEAAKARLDQLGPKPKEGQPEESADVAKDRAEREANVAELDETQRLGRTLLVQAEQLATEIGDRRRAVFARALFEQSSSVVSPELWLSVGNAIPTELRAQATVLGDALDFLGRNATAGALLLVGLALGAAVALYVGRQHVAPRLVTRDPAILDPPRRARLLAALAVLLLGAVPAILGSWIVWVVFDSVDIVPARLEPIASSVLQGLAFVAFVRALADAILAPGHTSWRLINLSEATVNRISTFAVTIASVIVLGKILETFNQAMAAVLPITVATRAIFSVLSALLLAELLRRFAGTATQDEECLGPYVAGDTEIGGPIRILGWTAVAAVIGSALGGYVALSSFLVDQLAWISILIALMLLSIALADEFIGGTLKNQTRIATALQANTGLRRRSLEQIGVLASGVARVLIILSALMLALAPWGIERTDIMSSLRAAFFGFQVGDVTISLSTMVVAALVFGLGFSVTRIVQRWLDSTFLPATDLDSGLRNSIRTGFGYVGIFAAGALAFSYLGLSLDRVAIVAGALSVGIGFGLQSIVNNFVSGLILLWERPIRVGDLVVVGDGEGYVRRINVRATEIETFDRSIVMVPNSNLISGVVRNRVRADRIGRVIVTVPVPRASDPDQVAEIMRTCALSHREVMSEPALRVFFKKIGETMIEFDLVCFVDEIDTAGRIQSDLYFGIYRQLRAQGIGTPTPVAVKGLEEGLEEIEDHLEHIADALEEGHGRDGNAVVTKNAPKPVPLPGLKPQVENGPRKQKDKAS